MIAAPPPAQDDALGLIGKIQTKTVPLGWVLSMVASLVFAGAAAGKYMSETAADVRAIRVELQTLNTYGTAYGREWIASDAVHEAAQDNRIQATRDDVAEIKGDVKAIRALLERTR